MYLFILFAGELLLTVRVHTKHLLLKSINDHPSARLAGQFHQQYDHLIALPDVLEEADHEGGDAELPQHLRTMGGVELRIAEIPAVSGDAKPAPPSRPPSDEALLQARVRIRGTTRVLGHHHFVHLVHEHALHPEHEEQAHPSDQCLADIDRVVVQAPRHLRQHYDRAVEGVLRHEEPRVSGAGGSRQRFPEVLPRLDGTPRRGVALSVL
mmetsp:Transcript_366/g.1558  ORF Transcript_366/g.1558 Transcript_366/m.1558 type:complete len:210 (-) Transcript_366:204-833(-)